MYTLDLTSITKDDMAHATTGRRPDNKLNIAKPEAFDTAGDYTGFKEVIAFTGIPSATLDRYVKQGKFPKPDYYKGVRIWEKQVVRDFMEYGLGLGADADAEVAA